MTRVQIFENLVKKAADTYKAKNADYGDSFVKVRQKYPNSILIRLNDKLSRLETLMDKSKDAQVKDESIDDTLLDLANYALMELTERIYEHSTMNINDSDCNNIADETVDEKLTPEDIIKALNICTSGTDCCSTNCTGCPLLYYSTDYNECMRKLMVDSKDLIADYKTQNDKLREQIARNSGNTTELSLILELLKISEEYKELKQQGNENSIVNHNR